MPEKKTPANWLRFQKSCSDMDPFDCVFRLLLLITPGENLLGFTRENVDQLFTPLDPYPFADSATSSSPFYICIDEAQRYLEDDIKSTMFFGSRYQNHLILVLEDSMIWRPISHGYGNLQYIVSGTSLKSENIISAITRTRRLELRATEANPTANRDEVWPYAKCVTITEFPFLKDDEGFKKLVEERGLDKKLQSHPDEIIKHGIPLRGRYLWSARYVDRLRISVEDSKQKRLDPEYIPVAALETMNEAKMSLKSRLSRLKREGRKAIIEELC